MPLSLPGPRHMEILRAAMELVAAHGYAGASLRDLAAKVGMSQPSLYHYFDSKDELIEQVIFYCGADMLTRPGLEGFPFEDLMAVPAFMVDYLLRLYDTPEYATFVRFMFAVSPIKQRYRNMLKKVYADSFETFTPLLMQRFVERGDIGSQDAIFFMRMLINSLGLLLMEKRVLYAEKTHPPEVTAYAAWLAGAMQDWLRTCAPQGFTRSGQSG